MKLIFVGLYISPVSIRIDFLITVGMVDVCQIVPFVLNCRGRPNFETNKCVFHMYVAYIVSTYFSAMFWEFAV